MAVCSDSSTATMHNYHADQLFEQCTNPSSQHITFFGFNLKTNNYFHISQSAGNILGFSPKEIRTRGIKWFVDRIHPEDMTIINEKIKNRPEMDVLPWLEYRFRIKNGSYIKLREYRCVLYNAQGKPTYMIGRIEKA